VVMDSGMGNSSESWLGIQPKVAEFARVCIYDRAGLGNSDPTIHNQTTTQIAIDIHNLLARAGVPRPLVLVGHSPSTILSLPAFVSRSPPDNYVDPVIVWRSIWYGGRMIPRRPRCVC